MTEDVTRTEKPSQPDAGKAAPEVREAPRGQDADRTLPAERLRDMWLRESRRKRRPA